MSKQKRNNFRIEFPESNSQPFLCTENCSMILTQIKMPIPKHYLLFCLTLLLFFQCSPKVEVEGIDIDQWKKDRNGCLGFRLNEIEQFREVKNEFLGKNNQALIKTFGRPDKVELADRSQTFFIYFIEPGPECNSSIKNDQPLKVIFRLNAISRVSEVTVSTLDP